MNTDLSKKSAALRASEFISSGMNIGLGTGSTVFYLLEKLREMVAQGLQINAVSSSKATEKICKDFNIPLYPMNEMGRLHITIDGADEVDGLLNGIKGGGGALLFEKIIATNSEKVIWICNKEKLVKELGAFPLPVEVVPMNSKHLFEFFEKSGYKPEIRKKDGKIFKTDSNNMIIDLNLGRVSKFPNIENILNSCVGVVEHGLFTNICNVLILGDGEKTEVMGKFI